MYTTKKNDKLTSDFSKIVISLTSPKVILERSCGEITRPETINYRTYKPEKDGLFCERVFGPIKDWECHCGKYRGIRYRGVVCDRCGVEVAERKVRRERMGHIKLVVPIAHTWFFRSLPNKIGSLLGLTPKNLEKVVYYERYVVLQTSTNTPKEVQCMDLLTEEEYLDLVASLPIEECPPSEDKPLKEEDFQNKDRFVARMGAEPLAYLLRQIDLDSLSADLRNQATHDTSQQRRGNALKRLRVVEAFRSANKHIENKPEWMVMQFLPVIPPELRPLLPLDGGRFATSDLNDLYRRVIIRNNRLKRLMEIGAPEVILRHERRMLQEAVDSLFDNSRKTGAVASEGMRPLKSLSDALKGKKGRFRQNLLGKRVDYSGRSVIVVGPELQLHECGLPKEMAVELFKPFIIRRLIDRGVSKTVKAAKRVVEQKQPVVWDVLENLLQGHPVLLNRAPTLHRLSIQAFQPKLIEGKAIQLHPLVCSAFNADFDGDTMSVHVPLRQEAIAEAAMLMLSSHNILNPANGKPIVVPGKEIVLGMYYLTKGRKSTPEAPVLGEGKIFSSPEEVIIALNSNQLSQHAHIRLRITIPSTEGASKTEMIDTVAGRVVFNQHVPSALGFINELLTGKALQAIVERVNKLTDTATTARFLDVIKRLGFEYAHKGGLTFALDDVKTPQEKQQIVDEAQAEVDQVLDNYLVGLITDTERYNQVVDVWTRVNIKITQLLMEQLEADQAGFNSVYMMMHSGARGSREQVRQLGGMRGLMAKPRKSLQGQGGEIIEHPILSNFKEGLDVPGSFISSHGARKGLADTALKTADAGYLTRRLVDVAQDITITEEDCGTLRGLVVTALKDNEEILESLKARILGRVALNDVHDPRTNKLILAGGEQIDENAAASIEATAIEGVEIRSTLTCESARGVCVKCYGRNLATNKMVSVGEAVGVIAAQSIGQPGTQLTMRTFHVGGAAANIATEAKMQAKFDAIVHFENLRTASVVAEDGVETELVIGRTGELQLLDPETKALLTSNHIPYGAHLTAREGDMVAKGQELCFWDPYNAVILSERAGTVAFEGIEEGITVKEEYDAQTGHREKVVLESRDKTKNPAIIIEHENDAPTVYNVPVEAYLAVEEGDKIEPGTILAKIPRTMSKSRDITGGLPRVTELFEARNPANVAVISEIDGLVSYGTIRRGNREILIEAKDGTKRRYWVPLSRHILVQDGDYVKAATPLSDGSVAITDILAIEGPIAAQAHIINGIQEVYRLQGEKINDKHIEIIVRQMMQKVEIVHPGDTNFVPKQVVDKKTFTEENDRIVYQHIIEDAGDSSSYRAGQCISLRALKQENTLLKRQDKRPMAAREAAPAVANLKIQGITRASINTESFISAASFQETAKVLSEAAVWGKEDRLHGLKENVIVGHRVPAGTGLERYKALMVHNKAEYEALVAVREAQEG